MTATGLDKDIRVRFKAATYYSVVVSGVETSISCVGSHYPLLGGNALAQKLELAAKR